MTKVGHIDDGERGFAAHPKVSEIEPLEHLQAGERVRHSLLKPQQLFLEKYLPHDPHSGKTLQRLEYQPVGLLRFQEKPSP